MTILVTGASGDIGSAIAKEFGKIRYNVAVHGHKNFEKACEIAQAINNNGGKASAYQWDIRDEIKTDEMISKIENELGSVDVLVNNSGISQIKLFDEITLDEWNEMIGVNLTGAFVVTKRCVKPMIWRKNGGVIINISSMWGQVGASCEVHYSASKGGLIAMTKALAKELAPSGIRVNCICPGVIEGKMNGHLSELERKELSEEIPLGNFGTAEDIAEMCLYLTEKGKYITGQSIGINGGIII